MGELFVPVTDACTVIVGDVPPGISYLKLNEPSSGPACTLDILPSPTDWMTSCKSEMKALRGMANETKLAKVLLDSSVDSVVVSSSRRDGV